jgi:uncharacterized protein (TIGR03067 family)
VVFTGINGREFKRTNQWQSERITFRADGSFKWEGTANWTPASWFRIDPTARPKTWNSYSNGGLVTESIYDFMSDDELQICSALRDHPRPTDFTFKAGSKQSLEVWRRVKDKK